MAAAGGRSDRVYHQDYIARIRYYNTLPPPPNPPKLLEIPTTGLSSGQYTSPAFASRLAREQPLNIEADAELGMPIDLVGIPGVFQGNESAIYALENPPPPHPHDRPLLRPLSTIGKGASLTTGVSFLRRTEYIASDANSGARFESTKARDLRLKNDIRKRKRPDAEAHNDPARILRAVTKGFDIAYPQDAADGGASLKGAAVETTPWDKPKHPTQPDLEVLDTYPILPDLSAFPDSGFYLLTKFITNPSHNIDEYDPRLDVGLLRPLDPGPEVIALLEAQKAAHDADPSQPGPDATRFDYEFFIPENVGSEGAIKKKFDVNDEGRDEGGLYDNENKENGKRFFRYKRLRAYETYQQTGDKDDYYGDAVALALHDGVTRGEKQSRLQKGAYYYPIMQRTYIRPRRAQKVGALGVPLANPEESKIDFLEVVVREADEAERAQRAGHGEVGVVEEDALAATEAAV